MKSDQLSVRKQRMNSASLKQKYMYMINSSKLQTFFPLTEKKIMKTAMIAAVCGFGIIRAALIQRIRKIHHLQIGVPENTYEQSLKNSFSEMKFGNWKNWYE